MCFKNVRKTLEMQRIAYVCLASQLLHTAGMVNSQNYFVGWLKIEKLNLHAQAGLPMPLLGRTIPSSSLQRQIKISGCYRLTNLKNSDKS